MLKPESEATLMRPQPADAAAATPVRRWQAGKTFLLRQWRLVRLVCDSLASLMALGLLAALVHQALPTWVTGWAYVALPAALVAYWLAAYGFAGLYPSVRPPLPQQYFRLFRAVFVGMLVLDIALFVLALGWADATHQLWALGYGFLQLMFTALGRWALRYWENEHKQDLPGWLVVGNGPHAQRIVLALKESGRPLLGLLATQPGLAPGQTLEGVPCLGYTPELDRLLASGTVDAVVMVPEHLQHEVFQRLLGRCELTPVRVLVPEEFYDKTYHAYKLTQLQGEPLVEIRKQPPQDWELAVKRFSDVTLSGLALLALSPLLLLLALLIMLDGHGNPLFIQERIGRFGRPFKLLKFRTMVRNAEAAGPALTQPDDPRITRLGNWLRKRRLDELPQLLNVVVGHMSLVGPRPERQFYIDQIVQHAPDYPRILALRPGITGWAQVKNGYSATMGQMLERLRYDRLYLDHHSLALDLKILLATLRTVLGAKGR